MRNVHNNTIEIYMVNSWFQKKNVFTLLDKTLSIHDKRKIRRALIKMQYELVTSCIIKNKTNVTVSHQTICQPSAKQDFIYERIKK